MKKFLIHIILISQFTLGAAGTNQIGVLQYVGEQGVRLGILFGKNTLFTGANLGYDYRFKKWLQLSGEFLFDYAALGNSDAYSLYLGFLPKFTAFSVARSRLAMNIGLGLYGANETVQNRLQEDYKNAWLYGFAAHGELDFYINSRFSIYLSGKQFIFPNASNVGVFRGYGTLGFKVMF